jgi:hypothetical protein
VDSVPIEDSTYVLVRNKYAYPLDINDGEIVYEGTGSSFKDGNTEEGQLYCYTLFIKHYDGDNITYYTSSLNRVSILSSYNIDFSNYMWDNLVWRNYKSYKTRKELRAVFDMFGIVLGNIKSKLKQIMDIRMYKTAPIERVKEIYTSRGIKFAEDLSIDFYMNELMYNYQGMKGKSTTSGIASYIRYLIGWELKILFTSQYKRAFYSTDIGSITFDPDVHRIQDLGTHRDILRRTYDYAGLTLETAGADGFTAYCFILFNTYRDVQIFERVTQIMCDYFPNYMNIIVKPMYFSYAVNDKEEDNKIEYTLE